MSTPESSGAIRAEVLANKLAAIRHHSFPEVLKQIEARPRIVEALWFLQWISLQPGGLERFARDLVSASQDSIGTKAMHTFGNRKYTADECADVWAQFPVGSRRSTENEFEQEFIGATQSGGNYCGFDFDPGSIEEEESYRAQMYDDKEKRASRGIWEVQFKQFLFKRNAPFIRTLLTRAAEYELPAHLRSLCESTDGAKRGFLDVWYFKDVLGAVIALMDRRAAEVERRIARTVVVEKVFDALQYAHSERLMVRIEGDSRFGKSESIETWADMWPGKARVVRTPPSNNEKDLHRAIAEAFGIHHSFAVRGQSIKDKVEHVIRHSGLMMIFDEGAFLLPQSYSKTTAPARLNWIRTAIVDRKIACVLVVTPQSYNDGLNKFTRKTGYSIEQFIGRESLRVPLPSELPFEDLLAVAHIHFPDADEDLLGYVASTAMQSESYLKAVENIARRARYIAQKRGAKTFNLRDVDQAIVDVMPARMVPSSTRQAEAPTPTPEPATSKRVSRCFKRQLKDAEKAFQRGASDKISTLPGRTDREHQVVRSDEEHAAVAG